MPLLAVNFPANILLFMHLLSFCNGDIFFAEWAYEQSFARLLSFPAPSPAYNPRFALLGASPLI